jgi:hypothetical protein
MAASTMTEGIMLIPQVTQMLKSESTIGQY